MAGDWIKMRVDLKDDPSVFKLAEMLAVDELHVIGCLFCFWAWADKHAVDGHVDGATTRLVDKVSSTQGFCAAMQAVGWLVVEESGVRIPNFDRHNGESAKERGLKNARQARWRAGNKADVDAKPSTDASTDPSTREEKRREEKKETQFVPAGDKSAKPTVPCPYQAIVDAYHETLPMLPKVKLLPASRQKAMRTMWGWILSSTKSDGQRRATTTEDALLWIRGYFGRASANDFLMGRTARSAEHAGWQCDLDFLLTDKGMKQVIERTQDAA